MPRLGHARSHLVHVLSLAVLLAALGCGEGTESPTAPASVPALAARRAQALSFRQVRAGWGFTCGVTVDDQAWCWGANFGGQLGDGTTTDRLGPVRVAGGLLFREISPGSSYTCGVTVDDLAYCWGLNHGGRLGDGTTTASLTPVAVAGGLRFRSVSAGASHTCGVTTTDQGYCWGGFGAGRGNEIGGEQRYRPFEVDASLRFRELSANLVTSALGTFSCGVTLDDVAYCWGDNDFGQLGIGGVGGLIWGPVAVAGGHAFRRINTGATRTCALTPDRRAWCWGANWDGDVGDGTPAGSINIVRSSPVPVAGGLRFRELGGGGEYHACAITQSWRAYCWGLNSYGQLGDGTTTNRSTPVAVATKLRFTQVGTGTDHTCGVARGHVAWCWGSNYAGQLGDGTTTPSSTPVPVAAAAP